MNILISACLLGVNCRYNAKPLEIGPEILRLMEKHTLIPVCPEVYGGLSTPRDPAEIIDGRVITSRGRDVTDNYLRGAQEALMLAKLYGCEWAILKERSPSCGTGLIYDGTFSGRTVPGYGVCAKLLIQNGIKTAGETGCSVCLKTPGIVKGRTP